MRYRAKPRHGRSVGRPATGGVENLGFLIKANRLDNAWKPRKDDSFDGGCLVMSGLPVSPVKPSRCSLLLVQFIVYLLPMRQDWAGVVDIGAHEHGRLFERQIGR